MSLSIIMCTECDGDEWDCPACVDVPNITHNLAGMASVAGCYLALWRPGEAGLFTGADVAPWLRRMLAWLDEHPDEAREHEAPNGWGTVGGMRQFCTAYLRACEAHPEAWVSAER